MNISTGKLRGLQQISGSNGLLTICAIDHRGSLKRALNKENPEAVSYPVGAEKSDPGRFAARKPELVIETARQITALPVDVLKAEFPADMNHEKDEAKLLELCRELDRASRRPWVLLSAGISFELFKKEVEIACKAGASGFLAGRALWQEGAGISSRVERMDFFNDVAASRLKEISEIAAGYGRPWYEKAGFKNGEFGGVSEGWYESY